MNLAKITFILKDFIFDLINISVEKSFEKENNKVINEKNNENNGFKNYSKKKKKKIKKNKFFLFDTIKKDKKHLDKNSNIQQNDLKIETNEKKEINQDSN